MNFPLGSLGLQITAHWKKYRPQMYAELEKSGHLLPSVYAAAELTSDLMYDLQNGPSKLPYQEAWELAREEWAFLPSEKDEPSHNVNPSELQSQLSELKSRLTRASLNRSVRRGVINP